MKFFLFFFLISSYAVACPKKIEKFSSTKTTVVFSECGDIPITIYTTTKDDYGPEELKGFVISFIDSQKFKNLSVSNDLETLKALVEKTALTSWRKQIETRRLFCFDKPIRSKFFCKHYLDLKYRKRNLRVIYNNGFFN